MKKRAKKHEHVNHERWLVSYADFITLLFAFFVVMFSVSQVDTKKLGKFSESVTLAFQFPGVFPQGQGSPMQSGGSAGNSIVPLIVAGPPTAFNHQAPSRRAKDARENLQRRFDAAGLQQAVSLRFDPRGLAVALPAGFYFYEGTARLRPEAAEEFRLIARALAEESVPIQIESHTDASQPPASQFASNWELSAARAARIADLTVAETRVDPQRLSASGLAQYHPLAAADGRSAADAWPRVDLVLIYGADTQ